MLNDTVTVGRVGEPEAENLRVLFGLLKPVAGFLVSGLGFYNSDGEIASVAQKVIGALLRATADFAASDDDAPVSEGLLFADLFVVPTCCI